MIKYIANNYELDERIFHSSIMLMDELYTRKNFNENVKVFVDGELNIKEKITNTKNNIEQRYTSKGIFFYAG